MPGILTAIDGPVGSGKSSIARRVAELLGFTYLDTGAMYRAVAWKALCTHVSLDDHAGLGTLAGGARIDLKWHEGKQKVFLDGGDVTSLIRTPEISQAASKVAFVPEVRRVLVAAQQRMSAKGSSVMEGRDIGTVVFPNAQLKIYLDATPEVRAARRLTDYQRRGNSIDLARLIQEVRERDKRDMDRPDSPLRRAADAVYVDNSAISIEETARLIAFLARNRVNKGFRKEKTSRTRTRRSS